MAYVETTSKPWFGPRRRARDLLSAHRTTIDSPEVALGHFREILGASAAAGISHIRFIDYWHEKESFRYTIAVCWTTSDPDLRQSLYDRGASIVDRTGWYPLPQGERLRSVESRSRAPTGSGTESLPKLRGALASVESAVRPEDGCSVRVVTTQGDSILLDSGLPNRLEHAATDRLLLLSHAHADHAGGLTTDRTQSLPTVMSPATARILHAGGWLHEERISETCVLAEPGDAICLGSIEIEPFMVPHFPGATGWILRDDFQAIIFTGDICLRTARHDFTHSLTELAAAETPRRVTVLLDATMAGRGAGASESDVASGVLAFDCDDIVVVAQSADHLLYGFLDLFHTVQQFDRRHSVAFLASPQLRLLFEILHEAFITRSFGTMDPMLVAQYGRSMSSWGESRWLFWLDRLTSAPSGRRVWFITANELADPRLPSRGVVASIGRDDLAGVALTMRPGLQESSLDTNPWTAHSDQAGLAVACRELEAAGHRVVLFHNFSKRVKKFVRDEGLVSVALSGSISLVP
jgi:hypothetical protein